MENDVKRPHLWNSALQISDFIISLITTAIGALTFSDELSNFKKVFFIIIIFVSTYAIILIICNIIYSIRLYKYSIVLEKRFKKLIVLLNENSSKYNNLYKDYQTSLLLGNLIIRDLDLAIESKTESETAFLKQLLSVIEIKQNARENLKGESNEK